MCASEDRKAARQATKLPRRRHRGTLLALPFAIFLCTGAAASAQTVTFTPGARQEFKVPVGVATVEVVAVGGEGQPGHQCRFNAGSGPGAGGTGALVTATIPVSGSETLYVNFGGGGAGGTNSGSCEMGGAGGDASEVLSEASTPLVVAGGGGGGGATMAQAQPYEEESEHGGAGGSSASAIGDGGNGVLEESGFIREDGYGGEGGGPSTGGAAGATYSGIVPWTSAATPGRLGSGGNGGSWNGDSGAPFIFGGGGGGGGYYGGGGGGAGNLDAGGGGAGSSYIDGAAGASGIVASGSGHSESVTLNYMVASTPTATISAPVGGGAYTQGTVVKTEFSCEDGAGGSGIESCVDSGGAVSGAGTLDTATVGSHTYTVTAKSKDGLAATAKIEYTVTAPAAQAASTPFTHSDPAPVASTTPKMCVSAREIAFHLVDHLAVPDGAEILRSEVLLAGRLVARVSGPDPVAHVSLVGLSKGAYPVTFFVRTSTGRLLRGAVIFHTCAHRPRPST